VLQKRVLFIRKIGGILNMNIRRWMAGCAVAAAAAGSVALAAPAGAATAGAATAGAAPVAITKVDLHPAYLRALPRAQHGPIKNKMLPRDAKSRAVPRRLSTQAGTCTEPLCDLAYGGGPVQHAPKVYLLLWGPKWSGTGSDTQYLKAFYSALGTAGDKWSTITSQYSDASGHPAFGGTVLAGVFQDTTTPAGTGPGGSVDPSDLNAEADAFVHNQHIADTANAQVMIASQSGTCFDDGWVGQPKSCSDQPTQVYCGWHTNSTSGGETFTNLPYTLDAGTGCGENFVNTGTAGRYDGFSIVGGHEYAETITDPQPDSGWFDPNDNVSGGEIGDKCAWSNPIGDVTFSTGTFAMQSLWSNLKGACVLSEVPPDTVTVTNPGAQATVYGGAASLQIKAVSSGGHALTYTAAGLPAGLGISSSGLISGKPKTAVSYTVTVTAKDSTGGLGKATFAWKVTQPNVYVKATKLTSPQFVVDGSHVIGTRAQVWEQAGLPGSNGSLANQSWTVTAVAGGDEVQLKGTNLCLDVAGFGITNGTHVQLWTCNGGVDQQWNPLSGGQLEAVYATTKSGNVMVLDDPGAGGNGTKLQIWQSNGRAQQLWTLP
jgi:serine protease